MEGIRHYIRASIICVTCLMITFFCIGYVLPYMAQHGYAGDVVQYGFEHERDATPLFYSESDRTWEIMNNENGTD